MDTEAPPNDAFAVWAETSTTDRPLLLLNLTFARLMDDVVVPYQQGEPFFIDGAPVKGKDLTRIKILKLDSNFDATFRHLNLDLQRGSPEIRKIMGDQYTIRLEALLRQRSEDVTAQVLKAFDRTIKPSLKDYLPKRDELIAAAVRVFMESMKALGS